MASFLNKIKVATAMQTRNTFDLSHINLTTQGFYAIKPVYCKEIIPNESIKIDYTQFTRLMPLSEPMMAHVNIVTRAFFVPFRTVWNLWTPFITGTTGNYRGTSVLPTSVPYITSKDLAEFLSGSECATLVADTETAYDFEYPHSGVYRKWRLTPYGRRCYDIFLNLGYSVNFTDLTEHQFSSLPLLCWLRLYFDWMQNTNYDNMNSFVWQFFDSPDNAHIQSLPQIMRLTTQALYRTDLFTSAFDHPTGPNSNMPAFSMNVDNPLESVSASDLNEASRYPKLQGLVNNSYANITQNGLYVLHALTDWYQRMRASGSRVLDRYFAEYGVKLSNEKLQRSTYLGGHENEISILDVMDTSSTGLGDFAGKGIGDLNGSFTYKSDEFGQLIILSYIEPRTSVCQGFERANLHLKRFDFFSGDMDAIGYQAISQGELFSDYKGEDYQDFADEYEYDPTGVFGYSGRYYEYKTAKDKLTGNFRLPSVNETYDRWHLFRMIPNGNDVTDAGSDLANKPLKHGLDFTIPTSPTLYNRVFSDRRPSAADPFFARWSFKVKASLPAKPLYEQYEYASHGEKEVINLGGTKVTD